MHRPKHCIIPVIALAIATGCAPASVPVAGAPSSERYVAPSQITVRASTEQAHAPRIGHTVYVENTSTVPIIVTSVTLRNCENIRGVCDAPTPINVRVKPGQREVIKRIDPRNEGMGFNYRLAWAWRAESEGAAIAAVLGDAGVGSSAPPETVGQRESVVPTRNDPYLQSVEIRAVVAAGGRLRVEPDSIEMRVGESRSIGDFRIALYDSAGVRRGRVPYSVRFPTNKISFAPPTFKAIAPGDAVITFTLPASATEGLASVPQGFLVVIIRE